VRWPDYRKTSRASEFTVAAVTSHLTTNIAVIRQFVERDITYTGDMGKPGMVTIA
jgi:RNA 3'-terminal phosphate cyclase